MWTWLTIMLCRALHITLPGLAQDNVLALQSNAMQCNADSQSKLYELIQNKLGLEGKTWTLPQYGAADWNSPTLQEHTKPMSH